MRSDTRQIAGFGIRRFAQNSIQIRRDQNSQRLESFATERRSRDRAWAEGLSNEGADNLMPGAGPSERRAG